MQRRRVLAGVLAHKNQDKNTHLPNRRFMKDVAENDRSRAESPEIITVILQYMHAQSDLVWDSAFCGGSQGVSDKCRALQRPFEMDLITALCAGDARNGFGSRECQVHPTVTLGQDVGF